MPQFGRLAASTLQRPSANGTAPELPWTISNALVQQVTYECTIDSSLEALPDILARPAPPYARIRIVDVPESPVGPYREALLVVSSRYLMLPRHYVVASIVTTEDAQAANAARGYRSTMGEVTLQQNDNSFLGTLADDTGLDIRIDSADAIATGPTVIRYDPDIVIMPDDGEPSVVTISADPPHVESAWLAPGTTITYAGGPNDSPWRRLRSRNTITCTIARQDITFPVPEVVKRPG